MFGEDLRYMDWCNVSCTDGGGPSEYCPTYLGATIVKVEGFLESLAYPSYALQGPLTSDADGKLRVLSFSGSSKPQTLKPKPSTPNPKPWAHLNSKPLSFRSHCKSAFGSYTGEPSDPLNILVAEQANFKHLGFIGR